MSDSSCLNSDTNWDLLAYPRQCGLLAEKPSRLGQAMHNAAFRAADLPFFYTAFPTQRTEVGIEAMRVLGFRGLSLTIPHKERAMSLVDAISPEVQAIGAINTLVNTGTLVLGYNTDCYGIQKALEEAQWNPTTSRVLVFGAGGAARAAVYVLKEQGCASVHISNRNPKRAENLAAQFSAKTLPWEKLKDHPADAFDILINATAIGMPGASEEVVYPLRLEALGASHLVFDMVTAETPLLRSAEQNGARCVRGIRMLFHQAVEQNRLFTEQAPAEHVMQAALDAAYV